jgi:hypothetical protein
MIRQLTADELKSVERLCLPLEFDGPVTLQKSVVVSLLNEVLYHRQRHAGGVLEIRSIVSMKDRTPYVTLTVGNHYIQLSVQETLDHAKQLIVIAAGAAADGFRDYREQKLGLLDPDDLPPPDTKDV